MQQKTSASDEPGLGPVERAEARVKQQRETIARLEGLEQDTTTARMLLVTLERELAYEIAAQDRSARRQAEPPANPEHLDRD